MPISYKHEFKFIHIPKNAGTSIEVIFDLMHTENLYETPHRSVDVNGVNCSLQHLPHSEINRLKPEATDWLSFTIIRNPYTRVLSEYMWNNKIHKKSELNTFIESEFNEWFDVELLNRNTDHKVSQSFMIDVPVDITLRFESLNKDFEKINSELNTSYKMKQHNKSSLNSSDVLNMLSTDTKDKIYRFYREDFNRFDYPKL